MNIYIESYGCTMNKNDSEQVRGLLLSNGANLTDLNNADYAIINTCAVKLQTEFRMLKRIRELYSLSKKKGFQLIVFGCLPKINPEKVSAISPEIIRIGPSLQQLAQFFNLPADDFSPLLQEERENKYISIISIARGCLGRCSFCSVKQTRGNLKSYSMETLNEKFRKEVKETKEVWLTAQDTGCYGKDLGTNLPKLLKQLLENKGNYRIRIGMMNPGHLKEFCDDMIPLYNDKRIYKFLHLPLQSGSNRILKLMNRNYSVKDFLDLVKSVRRHVKGITISTDIIAGFPTETEEEFKQTVDVLKKVKPDIVNISRYGVRPNTDAAKLKDVYPWIKKERSRKLSKLCSHFSLLQNKRLIGKEQEILVTGKGKKGNFLGRTENYKPVIIKQDLRGQFARVKIKQAFPTYLAGVVQNKRKR